MIRITDHAIVRYLERFEGLDVSEIKRKILPKDAARTAKFIGEGEVKIGTNHRVKIKDNAIVTVMKFKWHRHKRPKKDY